MTPTHVIILLLTGTVAGFGGGLLGLGGGFIMTPVQYIVFTAMGLPVDLAVKLAFGTNLMVIVTTAASATWRHSRKEAVWWRVALVMGMSGAVAAFFGAALAAHIPGQALKMAFGTVAILSAIRMLLAKQPAVMSEPNPNPWLWAVWALPIGALTGILGIGGGIVAVPVMVLVLKFKIHQAVATSLAMMMFTSLSALAGYIINGLDTTGLPPYSLGYVYLPSWLLLAVSSTGMAQVGAIAAHKLPARKLSYIFIAISFYMGLRMLGVFDWLGLPI